MLVRHLLQQRRHVLLGCRQRRLRAHRALHHLALHVEVLELLLEGVHRLRDLLDVVGRESPVQGLHDAPHRAGDALHLGLRLEARDDGVEARREAQVVEGLGLLPDGVLGVDLGAVDVALLDGLFDLGVGGLGEVRWMVGGEFIERGGGGGGEFFFWRKKGGRRKEKKKRTPGADGERFLRFPPLFLPLFG